LARIAADICHSTDLKIFKIQDSRHLYLRNLHIQNKETMKPTGLLIASVVIHAVKKECLFQSYESMKKKEKKLSTDNSALCNQTKEM
jgi:xanthine dehydrogenase iron-sulfur cluster and FAD-binding subunit A